MLTVSTERIKREIDLVAYVEGETGTSAHAVGADTWRFNPCPGCGGYDHFTVTRDSDGEWFYNTFEACDLNGGDIINFVKEYDGADFKGAVEKLSSYVGAAPQQTQRKSKKKEGPSKEMPLLNREFESLHSQLVEGNYFESRGIGSVIQDKYKLCSHAEGLNHLIRKHSESFNETPSGYMASYKHFIPILNVDESINHFLPRLDDASAQRKQHKIHNLSGRPARLFNDRYLEAPELAGDHIFVVEGAFDALSYEEIGYSAIALNSTANKNMFIAKIAANPIKYNDKVFIIVADNDKAGRELATTLRDGFTQHNVTYAELEISNKYKDPNDSLVADREGFEKETASFLSRMEAPDLVLNYMDEYVQEINKNKKMKGISTGFGELDAKLGGGLFPGLYTVGAISSLGKTTFVLQMADFIAASGQDVIFFSLEMGKAEVISKSFSRISADIASETGDRLNAKTTRSMLTGDADKQLFMDVYQRYLPTAQHMSIVEGNFKTDVTEIRRKVGDYVQMRKVKPVVVVDYLQILRPQDDRLSDKQAVDRSIVSLKQMSRDFDLPVILVSSFNRESYTSTVSYSSFKESGAIEYSSDVIIGLQLAAVYRAADTTKQIEKMKILDEAKNQVPRKVELVILKNRNGVPYARVPYDFYSKFNQFSENTDLPEGVK